MIAHPCFLWENFLILKMAITYYMSLGSFFKMNNFELKKYPGCYLNFHENWEKRFSGGTK